MGLWRARERELSWELWAHRLGGECCHLCVELVWPLMLWMGQSQSLWRLGVSPIKEKTMHQYKINTEMKFYFKNE